MADTWITNIAHFLDENGDIISEAKQARKLAKYLAAIIMIASFPDPKFPPGYKVTCRRRPNRKNCLEEIAAWIEPETNDVYWICPKCNDKGRINNWRETIWDLSDSEQMAH